MSVLPDHQPRMVLLSTRDFVSVDYERSMDFDGVTVLARKRTGSYARFVMRPENFTAWLRCDSGKHLASVAELHWGFTGDTGQSLKDELDIETADIEVPQVVSRMSTASHIPLSFTVPGVEVARITQGPQNLMSFRNNAGREVAYIDQDGNYVKVDGVDSRPAPIRPGPVVPPDLTGRIIDLE